MDWLDLAQDRDLRRALIDTVMNVRVPQNAGMFWSGCTTGGFSRRAQLPVSHPHRGFSFCGGVTTLTGSKLSYCE
jgi:hypothetical protein